MNRESEGCSLVVVERGAPLPENQHARHPVHVLVRQRDAESPNSLVARTHGELAYLDANGRRVDEATISCGQSLDPTACDARERLTGEVVEHLRSTPSARLVLVTGCGAGAELRTVLVSLAERALSVLAKSGGSVSLHFGEGCA